jgi:chromosome segregation ATPase
MTFKIKNKKKMKVHQLLSQTRTENNNLRSQVSDKEANVRYLEIKNNELEANIRYLETKNNKLEADLNLALIRRNALKYKYAQLQNRCELIAQELVNWRYNHVNCNKK